MLHVKTSVFLLSLGLLGLISGVVNFATRSVHSSGVSGSRLIPTSEHYLNSGLLGKWKFDGSFRDHSSLANHVLPVGYPGFADGKVGQALQLNGRNECVTVPKLATGITQFTLAAWIYVQGMPQQDDFSAIFHNNGWEMVDVHLGFEGRSGILDLGIKGNQPSMSIPSFKMKDFQNRWVYLAVTYDAKNQKEVRFFVDGRQTDNFQIENALPVNLGPGRIGAWDESGRWFEGLIDELYVYERTLTGEEIRALFDLGSSQ